MKKITLLLALLLNCNISAAQSQHINLQEFGSSFDIPAGWTGQEKGDYIILGHQTIPGMIIIFENKSPDTTTLQKLAMQGISDEGIQLSVKEEFVVKNNQVQGMYEDIFDGTKVLAFALGLINGHGSGINIIILTETNKFSNTHKVEAKKLAASVKFFKSKETNQTVHWKNKIVGMKLKYINTISDSDYVGGSSGVSQVTIIDLCSNGRFFYYSNSHSNFSSGDADGEVGTIYEQKGFGFADATGEAEGSYEIYSLGNETMLELKSDKTYEYDLSVDNEGSTFLDSTRYLVLETEKCN